VFHCDLLSHASSSGHEEYAVDYISDVKIDNWPRRRDPYLQFLTHFVSFDIPEWLLLEQVDDCEKFSFFKGSEKGNTFSKGKYYFGLCE